MKRVYDFLKTAGTYFLATTQGDQPRVRPFGTVDMSYMGNGNYNIENSLH